MGHAVTPPAVLEGVEDGCGVWGCGGWEGGGLGEGRRWK